VGGFLGQEVEFNLSQLGFVAHNLDHLIKHRLQTQNVKLWLQLFATHNVLNVIFGQLGTPQDRF
jgi:hypothetical protein